MKRIIFPAAGLILLIVAGCATDTSKLPRFARSSSSDEDAIRKKIAKDDFPNASDVGLGMGQGKSDAE